MATVSQPLTNAPFDLDATLWGFVTRELGPTPGRLGAAARVAITAAIMLLIGEACHSEVLFIALFIPLLIPRDTPEQTWAATKGTIIITWVACAASIVLVLLTADLPGARVVALAIGIFACMILSRGLHQPPIAALGPVTISQVLIRMDSVNSAEAAITSGLWMALMMSAGCLVATAVDFLFPHPGPQQRITKGIVDRLQAAAAVLNQCNGAKLSREEQQRAQSQSKLALAGTSSLRKLLPALSSQPTIDKNYVLRLSAVLNGIDLLSDHVVQLSKHDPATFSEEQKAFSNRLAQACMALADHVQRHATTSHKDDEALDSSAASLGLQGPGQLLADMGLELNELWILWCSDATAKDAADSPGDKAPKAPPRSGPFVTPDDIRFAVKVTLASMICYVIYNLVAWQGISTALLTCYLTADTTIGGTFRKLALRIAGVLVGGLLFGIAGISLITSHMDNVVEFTLYVAVVFFVAGWVGKGDPRVAYAGSQIGISFGLVALMTPVITTEILESRDRLVGILLGTVVMWFIFTRFWPVNTLATLKKAIAGLIQTASDLALLTTDGSPADAKSAKVRKLRESINQGITQAEDQADLSEYESRDKKDVQSALRKCLAGTQDLLMLEMAQVDLSIRSAQDADVSGAFDKEDAQKTAEYLCLLAKQIVAGSEPLLSQLKEKSSQFQAAGDNASHSASKPEEGKPEANQAVVNANEHIRRRRNGLLENLLSAVKEATFLPH